jgi:succinylarginine dihydrolase
MSTLRQLGFRGSEEQILARAASDPLTGDHALRLCSSAAAMWTANAATCIPATDSGDGRLHIVPANLTSMFHRVLEADTTVRVLRSIFAAEERFAVHDPLPGGAHFSDEGAANHIRLFAAGQPAVHLFAWGRAAYGASPAGGVPLRYPARQTREASAAVARLGQIDPARALFPQQHPMGIDAGAFHTDVVAVGNGNVLLVHELAFVQLDALLEQVRRLLDGSLTVYLAAERDLPVSSAVATYPFNSQLLTLPDGNMIVLAPLEAAEEPRARAYLESVSTSGGPVKDVRFLDLRDSMENGGGPACLRQRIVLRDEEQKAVRARVFLDETLASELEAWIRRHYRDRLAASDLRDALLWRESCAALDELTAILRLGPIYDFQR